MADSGNNSSSLRAAYCSQKGMYLDLKAKLKKAAVADGVMRETVKWLTGVKNETVALVFDDVEEGGPLHQCGIRNGDELTSVNHAKVDCSHDVNHIASVIRDCSPTVMLGIKRRRVVGSVPVVVLFQLSDVDSNPVHRFCGFYWGILPKDIPFIPVSFDSIEMYNFSHTQENVEVIATLNNVQYSLTFKNGKLTFEPGSSNFSNFVLYVYTSASKTPPVPSDTPVIFVPQHDQSSTIDATINDEVTMSTFSSTYYRGNNILCSGVFLKVFGVTESLYHIKSSQTSSFMEVTTLPDGTLVPVMSSNPTPFRLQDSTTGNHISL
ncbi:hypothetical protein HOLleu_13341 [Holothuria leucospilota]|uniref:PDZ domain-containing protein n=1 Tax=Holothuria leucospilota TaxID=206669 RepID=A0A9Q1CAW1_HOLLE|nr:hypothetical protein HOLleu_13341 [Holothuria leucospilota]